MAKLDGSIRIGVVFEDKKIALEMDKLEQKLEQKLEKQNRSIKDQQSKVKELEGQYARLVRLEAEPKSLKRMEADLKKVQAEGNDLYSEFERLNQIASIERQATGAVSPDIQGQLDDISEKLNYADLRADALQRRIQEIRLDPSASDEAQKLAGQLEAAKGQLEQIRRDAAATEQARAELEAEANSIQGIAGSAQVADQYIVDLNRELAGLTARMRELQNAGVGLGYKEFDQISARIKEINDELKEYRDGIYSIPDPGADKWEKITNTLKRGLSKTVESASKAAKRLWGRIKAIGRNNGFEKAGKSADRFGKRLKSIVAGALFFNILSRGLNELTKQLGAYLKVNDGFSRGLTAIKSNLLTAFQPIYDVAIPALNALMGSMQQITAQAAAFIASLFGTTAEKAQEDAKALKEQADAIEETGDAAKKAEKEQKKYLTSFDTIEKLGSDKSEEKGEEKEDPLEGFKTDFAAVKIPSWLEEFWKVFADSWEKYGAAAIQKCKDALSAIWDMLKAIGRTFMDLWTGGPGAEFLSLLQKGFQLVLDIIRSIAEAFTAAWNSGAGEAVLQALFFMLNSIWELILSIGQAFLNVWNNGTGETILTTILNILANIMNTVGELANRLREAWEANGNGEAIWQAVLDIIQLVLSTIERITEATLEWAKELDLEPLITSIRGLLESVRDLVRVIGDLVAEYWESTILPFFKKLLEEYLPAAIDWISKLFDYLAEHKDVLIDVTKLAIALFAAFQIAGIISTIYSLVKALDPLNLILAAIIGTIAILILKWDEFVDNVKSGIQWLKEQLPSLIIPGGSGLVSGIKNIFGGGRATLPASYTTSSLLDAYPHLAKGAVISPNNEFLAVLGDQKHGTNVEAPLATIEQAVRNAMSDFGGTGGDITLNIKYTGSLSQIARLMQPEITADSGRRGVKLVTGGAY